MTGWSRDYYEATDARYLLHYVIPGEFGEMAPLSRERYRSGGPRDGWTVTSVTEPEPLRELTTGLAVAWEWLSSEDPALAARIAAAPMAMVLRAEGPDEPDLGYLRDAIGLVTYLLDNGGIAVRSTQTLAWHSADDWRSQIFEADAPRPSHHAVILASPEPGGSVWMHTRGMRAFARPDMSIRGVPPDQTRLAETLINRFIGLHAAGGVIPEGQEAFVSGMSDAMVCRHGGDLEDPECNNVHVAMEWP